MCKCPSKSDSSHCGKHFFYKSRFAAKIDYKLLQSGLGFLRWVTVFLLTLVLRWWVAPGCHPSLPSTDPTHLSHMSNPDQHTTPSLLHKLLSQITLWEEEHHSSQVHKPQDKQHSTSYDWTKPGLFLTAQSSAQSGVGGCSHWRNVLWCWMHKSSWTIPLWGYSQSYLLGIRTASQHSHTQTTEHYFS